MRDLFGGEEFVDFLGVVEGCGLSCYRWYRDGGDYIYFVSNYIEDWFFFLCSEFKLVCFC